MKNKLNLRQSKFVKNYLKTKNATESAMIAYNCKDRDVASATGSRLLRNVKVKEEIQRYFKGEDITISLILNTLKTNLVSGAGVSAKASDSNRAAELLLKASGAFDKQNNSNTQINFFANLENLSTPELIKKRDQTREYFKQILEG